MKQYLRHPVIATLLLLACGILIKIGGDFVAFYGGAGWKSAIRVAPSTVMALQTQNVKQALLPSRKPGLPAVRLFISEKATNRLMSNPPTSLKKWQRGFMIYPNGHLRRIKVRIRGEHVRNWLYPQKSYRIKMRRKHLIGRQRDYNYIRHRSMPTEDIIPYRIAAAIGLPSPSARLVELFINDKSHGVYLELEHPNENFLRNQRRMPVNLYKGEGVSPKKSVVGPYHGNLFNDASVWSKTSANNRFPEGDHHDLEQLLNLIRQAENDQASMVKLTRRAPFKVWARFAAFQEINQSLHNSNGANIRLIMDDWSGHATPMPWDTIFRWKDILEKDPKLCGRSCKTIVLDRPSNELLALYQRHSGFLLKKYQLLYSFLTEKKVLKSLHKKMTEQTPLIRNSLERDVLFSSSIVSHELQRDGVERSIRALHIVERLLLEALTSTPKASWQMGSPSLIHFSIQGRAPVGKLTGVLKPGSRRPTVLALDIDRNGYLSAGDLSLPFKWNDQGHFEIDAVWLANRIRKTTARPIKLFSLMGIENSLQKTRFSIVGDSPFEMTSLSGRNALTSQEIQFSPGKAEGYPPGLWNVPVLPIATPPVQNWDGRIIVRNTRHIWQPVRIASGTVIEMAKGVSLVFHNPVYIEGTTEKQVHIRPLEKGKPWGVVALQGEGTAGSRVSYLQMDGGSGGIIDAIQYTAMLSIHDTHDIEIEHLSATNNIQFDDMVHVIYCKDILFSNINLTQARSDAIDIDISDQVVFRGGQITNSGNDAIDFMDSRAHIFDVTIRKSGDKGISIGEDSHVVASQLYLHRNKIGIESKDASMVDLFHSRLENNETQLHAYKKNWRYGRGGQIRVQKSLIHSPSKNKISADKRSGIQVDDSAIWPPPDVMDRHVSYGKYVDFEEAKKSRFDGYLNKPLSTSIPDQFSNPGVRGIPQ